MFPGQSFHFHIVKKMKIFLLNQSFCQMCAHSTTCFQFFFTVYFRATWPLICMQRISQCNKSDNNSNSYIHACMHANSLQNGMHMQFVTINKTGRYSSALPGSAVTRYAFYQYRHSGGRGGVPRVRLECTLIVMYFCDISRSHICFYNFGPQRR